MNLVAACRDPFGEYLHFAENPVRCFWIHSFSLVSCLVSLQVPSMIMRLLNQLLIVLYLA